MCVVLYIARRHLQKKKRAAEKLRVEKMRREVILLYVYVIIM